MAAEGSEGATVAKRGIRWLHLLIYVSRYSQMLLKHQGWSACASVAAIH